MPGRCRVLTDQQTARPPIDFAALLGSSPNPYVLLDPALTIVWMNEAYLRATMRERAELVDRPMFEAFPSPPDSESHKLLIRSLERVLATGRQDEIALIRYDILMPGGDMQERYWSATHTPLTDEHGNVAYILQHTVDVTELHSLRRLRDEMGVVQRAQAVQARNVDLADETERMRMLFDQAPGFVAVLEEPGHQFLMVNDAYRSLVGGRDLLGKGVSEALPEVVRQGFVDLLDSVAQSGTPYVGSREKVQLTATDNGGRDERYLDFVYQPILGETGEVTGILVQGHDVTEQVHAEERQQLMINELDHRVKNTLAIVQGLAMQSFRQVEGSETARATFGARLNALAAAHTQLTTANWKAGSLHDIVRGSIEATAGLEASRVALAGPNVFLSPQISVSLAMIVHELSTNAIKYGALSVPDGRVAVTWEIEPSTPHRQLTITWEEIGGPTVVKPARKGFGVRLIQGGLSSDLPSAATIDFRPEGLRCTIEASLREEDL